jgi:hypothetical protein
MWICSILCEAGGFQGQSTLIGYVPKMNKMNWFDMSLTWKLFSVIVLLAFVLMGVILILKRATFMKRGTV